MSGRTKPELKKDLTNLAERVEVLYAANKDLKSHCEHMDEAIEERDILSAQLTAHMEDAAKAKRFLATTADLLERCSIDNKKLLFRIGEKNKAIKAEQDLAAISARTSLNTCRERDAYAAELERLRLEYVPQLAEQKQTIERLMNRVELGDKILTSSLDSASMITRVQK